MKQFIAYYVRQTTLEYSDRAVWVSQVRGITPFEPIGGGPNHGVPENARNHFTDVVDAKTGEWLSGGSTPQPAEPAP